MRISDWSSDVCSSDLWFGSWGSAAEHDAIVGAEADEPVDCRWILHRITARRFLQGHAAQELAHRHFHFLAGQRVGNVGDAVELIRHMPRTAVDAQLALDLLARSEERRVGKACVSTCRSRWSPYH